MNNTPDGFPAANLMWDGTESKILDNARDMVTYRYVIRVVQEKLAENFGAEKAEQISRERETEICNAFRANNRLGLAGVIRTLPLSVRKSYINDNSNIALDITLSVETTEFVTLSP